MDFPMEIHTIQRAWAISISYSSYSFEFPRTENKSIQLMPSHQGAAYGAKVQVSNTLMSLVSQGFHGIFSWDSWSFSGMSWDFPGNET
jgi:hypothetical protein